MSVSFEAVPFGIFSPGQREFIFIGENLNLIAKNLSLKGDFINVFLWGIRK
jgi:hypothetical protein